MSTINKAKGNEAGMVYVVGADSVFINRDNVVLRNKLFTAITRTKGWVTITGSSEVQYCLEELNELKSNGYKLVFKQPDKETTKMIESGSRTESAALLEMQSKCDFLLSNGYSMEDIIKYLQKK